MPRRHIRSKSVSTFLRDDPPRRSSTIWSPVNNNSDNEDDRVSLTTEATKSSPPAEEKVTPTQLLLPDPVSSRSPSPDFKNVTKMHREHSFSPPLKTAIPRTTSQPQTYDSDSEDDDDALSVLEDVEQEQTQKIPPKKSIGKIIGLLFYRVFICLVVVTILITPGLICEGWVGNKCKFNDDVTFWPFSYWLTLVAAAWFGAHLAVACIVFAIERTPYLGPLSAYYVRSLRLPLRMAITAVISYFAYLIIFRTSYFRFFQSEPGTYMHLSLICILVTAIAFLIEALLIRLMAIRFHRGAYYRRIKKSLFEEYVLLSLLHPSRYRRPYIAATNRFQSTLHTLQSFVTSRGGNAAVITSKDVQAFQERQERKKMSKGSQWWSCGWFSSHRAPRDEFIFDSLPLTEQELLDRSALSSYKLAGVVEFIKTRDLVLEKMVHAEDSLKISRTQAARLISQRLFDQLKQPTREEVLCEDFERILGPSLSEEAFRLFDGNWDNSLSQEEIYTTILAIARERKALQTALNDGEVAISKLNTATAGLTWFILMICYFLIFGVDANKLLVTLASLLLATAFAIGNTVRMVLESVVFLFFTHPFDIGDRVSIDGTTYTVARMNILTTEMKRYDNATIYFSNAVLTSKSIINLRRSPDQFDLISMEVAYKTPSNILRAFENGMERYILRHSNHYYRRFEIEYKELEASDKIIMRLWVQHRSNFQNMRRFRERRGRLLLKMKRLAEQLGMELEPSLQRVQYEVNSSGASSVTNY